MNRRLFLATAAQATAALTKAYAFTVSAPAKFAVPSADQVAWQNLELGMFVHLAPNTWQDVESDNLTTPLSEIDPKELNTDQWAQTALDLGARYIVFVAKHQGGFCMWQTHTTDYGIRNTPWRNGKGDVLADVVASCKKFGLKLGVYVCPRDDHFGATTGGICKTPELQAKYDALYREQLTEVFSRYGSFVEIWFDGSTATPVGDLLTRYQPHAVIFQGPQATIRWVGNENGFAPYPCWNGISRADAVSGTSTALNSDPNGDTWLPNEVDVSMRRPNWFWSTKNDSKVLTRDQLLSIYYRSVGRGTQLLINIPGMRTGLLPALDCAVAKSFGDEVRRRFDKPIATTNGPGKLLVRPLASRTLVDTIILKEDIAMGERVRAYRLEALIDDAWIPVGEGTAIGHKRIHPIKPIRTGAVRVVITESVGEPFILSLAVYSTGVEPPADWNASTELWATDLAGAWKNHSFSIDLTGKMKSAAQYRLRFIPHEGRVNSISDVVFLLHDAPQPGLVKSVRNKPDELTLNLTEIGGSVHISGHVDAAESGQILVQKL